MAGRIPCEAGQSLAQRHAAEQYESQRRRFEAGLSTVFLVLERQTALVDARPASCARAT